MLDHSQIEKIALDYCRKNIKSIVRYKSILPYPSFGLAALNHYKRVRTFYNDYDLSQDQEALFVHVSNLLYKNLAEGY